MIGIIKKNIIPIIRQYGKKIIDTVNTNIQNLCFGELAADENFIHRTIANNAINIKLIKIVSLHAKEYTVNIGWENKKITENNNAMNLLVVCFSNKYIKMIVIGKMMKDKRAASTEPDVYDESKKDRIIG